MADAQKNMRKSERKIKELSYQQDEDRKNHERRQRRSPPSTWPSTGRPRTALPMPPSAPTRTSRPSLRTVLGLAAHPLDLCKWKTHEDMGCRASIYNARDLLPC